MKKEAFSPLISIRWITVTCFEIKIGDKTVVIDPFIGLSPGTDATAEIIEGADIILVSHTHWDHVTDIGYLMDKFESKVIVGDLSAMDLAKYLNRNAHFLYPVCHNTELDFGWVKIKALMGRHQNMRKPFITTATSFKDNPLYDRHKDLYPLGWFGTLEYRNYIITTPHFKILTYGNTPSIEQLNMLKDVKPDLAILQLTRPIPEEIAAFANDIGAKIVIPHHMDLKKTPEEYLPVVEAFCEAFRALCPGGIAINPEHGRWYDISLNCFPRF
ncbi:MAG: hypothetical protein APF77_07190 [Clostridia bacterium BRH_c25]|nr:MAG: hypothetical protein APF77_07190 [Clostridia bacterium BRH_c25]